jgi:hypothetical protein
MQHENAGSVVRLSGGTVTAQWFLAEPSDQRLSALDGRGRRTGAKAAERMTS